MSAAKKRHTTDIIEHAAYTDALEQAYVHISRAEPGTLLLIVGMSGAGKNTIMAELERRLAQRNTVVVEGEAPIVKLLAANTNNAFYASKDAASRLVDALKDPFSATNRGDLLAPFGISAIQSSHRSVPETTLRRTATRLLQARKTRFLFVDEADMMCVIQRSGRDPADHLESWRLLALEAEVVIVLLATYRILTIWDRTSQFTRKMPTVHVRRYVEDKPEDVEEFVGLIGQLCTAFKTNEQQRTAILGQARAIMAATGGIFGQLLALFERADDFAEAGQRPSISITDLKNGLPRKRQVVKLWQEIVDGEGRLESSDFESVVNVAKAAAGSYKHHQSPRAPPEFPKKPTHEPGAGPTPAPTGKRKRSKGSKARRKVRQ